MSPALAAAVLAGTGLGVGLALIAVAAVGHRFPAARPAVRAWAALRRPRHRLDTRRLVLAVAGAVVVLAWTRWPVAAVLAAVAVYALPHLLGPDRTHQRALARVEAVAVWTESLRDTLSAAAGLEQAIIAASDAAPEAIREEVRMLAARIRRGQRLPEALEAFALDLDDATGDLVITALVMAAQRHARHIGDLLGSLATAAREQAALRMRVAAGRARVRTTVRVVVAVTVTMAGALLLFNRAYLAPFDTIVGQLVLLLAGGLFAAGIWWLTRISVIAEPARVLAPTAVIGPPAQPLAGVAS